MWNLKGVIIVIVFLIIISPISSDLTLPYDDSSMPRVVIEQETSACSGGTVLLGNGTCATFTGGGGGNFTSTDFKSLFQASFDLNWTALDYDKWMYNHTLESGGVGSSTNVFDQTLNTTSNVSFNNVSISTNLSSQQGFFTYLFADIIGSLTDRIDKIFVTEIDLNGVNVSTWLYNQSAEASTDLSAYYNRTDLLANDVGFMEYNKSVSGTTVTLSATI